MNIDLDKVVDYKAEYSRTIKKAKVQGGSVLGLCPFHQDRNPSFSADTKTGQFTCFACGASGNYIDFVARMEGLDTKGAYIEILRRYGISPDEPKQKPEELPYDVDIYADEKHLDKDFLVKDCHLSAGVDRYGNKPYVKIPYMDEKGTQILFRKRYHPGCSQRFSWSRGSKGKLTWYGLWKLEKIKAEKTVIIVEGESDAQSLWTLGFPALGVPGASVINGSWVSKLEGLDVYIHIEPDAGGKTFEAKVTRALADGGFEGKAFTWSCSAHGVKDPSALLCQHGRKAADMIRQDIKDAKVLEVSDAPVTIEDAPTHLRQPDGWFYSNDGIFKIDEKTELPIKICRTPIIITRRLRNDVGEEKVEVAFKRDGKWKSTRLPRSTVFQARGIIVLSDLGCTVTSENSKQVVRFLQALEDANIDLLRAYESTTTFGWQTGKRFIPGHEGDLELDIDPSMQSFANAYCTSGTLDEWVEQMKPLRSNQRFRFILSASFAAPLLRILKQRIFFVYNWGGSQGGKTAAMKAALSAWGDPDSLMMSFNATQVGLERTAAFFSDLPLGIDERQLAGEKQETLEKLIYMLSSGQGKMRGQKTGGIQAMSTWRTVVIASGEEPIAKETSQTGVMTRMIEIIGAPFDNPEEAKLMHLTCGDNCGWAGRQFISYLLENDAAEIDKLYKAMTSKIHELTKSENGSHVSAIAAVATADILAGRALFTPDMNVEDLIKEALDMAITISSEMMENEPPDVNVSATRFILDWLQMNAQAFGTEPKGQRYGFTDAMGDICIYPTALRVALEDQGFSSRKTLKYLKDNAFIRTQNRSDRKVNGNTVTRWFEDKNQRVVCLDIAKIGSSEGFEDYDQLNFQTVPAEEVVPY